MTMNTYDLIINFLNGWSAGTASNKRLRIVGNKLYNYSTCIAIRKGNNLYVNNCYYSRTTSKHQNRLKNNAEGYNVILLDNESEVMAYE